MITCLVAVCCFLFVLLGVYSWVLQSVIRQRDEALRRAGVFGDLLARERVSSACLSQSLATAVVNLEALLNSLRTPRGN